MPTAPEFSTERLLKERARHIVPRLAFRATTRSEWEAWRTALVAKTWELLRVPRAVAYDWLDRHLGRAARQP